VYNMLKYQNLLIWLFLSITTGYCAEQGSIEGRICDESTGLGLKGVNVVILHSNMGASSDDDGYYQISNLAPGKYALRFSAIGYKKIVID